MTLLTVVLPLQAFDPARHTKNRGALRLPSLLACTLFRSRISRPSSLIDVCDCAMAWRIKADEIRGAVALGRRTGSDRAANAGVDFVSAHRGRIQNSKHDPTGKKENRHNSRALFQSSPRAHSADDSTATLLTMRLAIK